MNAQASVPYTIFNNLIITVTVMTLNYNTDFHALWMIILFFFWNSHATSGYSERKTIEREVCDFAYSK